MKRLQTRALVAVLVTPLSTLALVPSSIAAAAPASVSASSAAPAVEPGVPYPGVDVDPDAGIRVQSVSDTYVGLLVGQPASNTNPVLQVHRIADGSLAREVPFVSQTTYDVNQPRVVGRSVVQLVPGPDGRDVGSVATTDIETGERRELVVPATEGHLASGSGWLLSCGQSRTTVTDRVCTPHLQTATGVDVTIDLELADTRTWVDPVTQDVVVGDHRRGYDLVDTEDGTTRPWVHDSTPWVATTTSYFWRPSESFGSTMTLRWASRDTGTVKSVVIQGTEEMVFESLVAYGEGVALKAWDYSEEPGTLVVRPVDLATGALAPALPAGRYGSSTPDGTALATTESGSRLVAARPDRPVRTVVSTSTSPRRLASVRVSDGRVMSSFYDYGTGGWQARFVDAAGQGTWTADLGGGTSIAPIPDDYWTNPFLDYSSSVLLTDPERSHEGIATYRLTWPGGGRSITSAFSTPHLGTGGSLVVRAVEHSSGGWIARTVAEDTRTGRVAHTVDGSVPMAASGRWVWWMSDRTTLRGTDTTTGAMRTIPLGMSCAPDEERLPYRIEVRGRWAGVECGPQLRVVDLNGVVAPRAVTPAVADNRVRYSLGDGFAVGVVSEGGASVVDVVDLSNGARRSYGPTGGAVSADDSGAPVVAYLDPQNQARRISLSWLGVTPTGPVRANGHATISGTPRLGGTLTAAVDWIDTGVSSTYQWFRNGTAISGATGRGYVVTEADLGSRLSVHVLGSHPSLTTTKVESGPLTVPLGTLSATAAPRTTGNALVGHVLTSDTGRWSQPGTRFAVQWYRSGAVIPGAAGTAYRLTTADIGHRITSRVTAAKNGFQTASVSSAASPVVRSPARVAVAASGNRSAVTVTVSVSAPGIRPGNLPATVYVQVDGRNVVKTTLGANGTVRVTLRNQPAGWRAITAVYAGTPLVLGNRATVATRLR